MRVVIGDLVYCTSEIQNVYFLQKPTHRYGNCIYETINGEIKEAPTLCFRIVSKGSKCAQYKTKDQQIADSFDHLARSFGFRVEKIKLKDSYLLKIFGDTQEEVDDFVFHLKTNQVLGY
jgi:hypothetical protein